MDDALAVADPVFLPRAVLAVADRSGMGGLMRMPGMAREPLPDQLEQIRQMISALPRNERRQLMRAVNADVMRANDARHNACADAADREMQRRTDQIRAEGGELIDVRVLEGEAV